MPAKPTPAKNNDENFIPGQHGGKLRRGGTPGNSGGKKGRSGRPPMAFKKFLAQMRQDPSVQFELERALKDREGRAYAAALKVLTDYDDDLPANLSPEERAAKIQALLDAAAQRKAQA